MGIKTKKFLRSLPNTTIDPITLSKILRDLKKNIDNVIMEASSHGLKQHRLDGLLFDTGIFTNLSHDHLDYHKNLKDYLNSKLYLFKKLLKKGNIITDSSISEFNKIKKISKIKNLKLDVISKNNENLGIKIIEHKFDDESQMIHLNYKNNFKFKINLIGKVQLKNILMASLAAEKVALNFQKLSKLLNI